MTTGAYWDLSDPRKPLGELDVHAKLDIPWDWSTWLAEVGTTLATPDPAGHDFTLVQAPLMIIQSAQTDNDTKVVARVAVDPGLYVEATHLNKKFAVTCHIVAADGQEDDRTLWFKIVSL